MFDEVLNKCAENNNYTIYTSMCKAQCILMRSYDPVCSISGGSDSDIVLDLIHKVDEDGRVKYFWIDTGLEYSATKEHLDYLEQKYGITIERVKPDKPIPNCVKQYGIPFLSKYSFSTCRSRQTCGRPVPTITAPISCSPVRSIPSEKIPPITQNAARLVPRSS